MASEQDTPYASRPAAVRRRAVALAVAGACLTTLALKLWVNAERTLPGYGDISYYATLAKNLAAGRGFVLDYIPDFLSRPTGIPHPANTYWMPLAAMIGAVGVWLGEGHASAYVGAQTAMIVFSSLAPLGVYLLGRDVLGSVRTGLVGAWLAAPFHLFLVSASLPLTHGPSLVAGTFAFWALHRACRDVRFAKWAGVATALAHMNRSDGVLLFGVALVVWRFAATERLRARELVARLLRMAAAYALVMLPLWWINVRNFGAPLPTGLARLVFLTDYAGLYSLPEHLTFERFWSTGLGRILAQRRDALVDCLQALCLDFGRERGAEGGEPLRWSGAVLFVPLVWVGLVTTARRAYVGVGAWVLLTLLLYAGLFAETGPASFHAALFAVFPWMLLAAGRVLERIAGALGRGRRASFALLVLAVAGLGIANVRLARAELERGIGWIERQYAFHRMLVHNVLEPRGLSHARIFAQQVHQLHANTGLPWVSLPFEPEPVIREVAERLDVGHVLLIGRPRPSEVFPAPYEITRSEHYELLFAGDLPGGRVGLYRIR